jgi:2-phospho-L-lactate guanylyltransferase
VLVPVKSFREAKVRLAPALSADERSELARTMATRVVGAAHGLPVSVVCDDDDVAAWADANGASVIWTPGLGLNREQGAIEVVVAHGDLPLADDLTRVTGFPGVTLVPDRHDDGTNVLCLPTGTGFTFAYGPGSFSRHRDEVDRLKLPYRVLRDPRLGWDIDVPADLELPSDA